MKRYNKKTIGFMFGGLLCLSVSACVSDPLDDEQYTKKLTLIGAQEELQEKEVKYGSNGEFFVTAYCGGTKIHGEDVTVTLGEADQCNIDNYNYKNVLEGETEYVALPKEWYDIPSYTRTIKSSERYVRFPVRVNTDKIDADSRYLIPLKIVDSKPYPVNEQADTVLLVKVKMINDYSGNYMMKGTEYPMKEGIPDLLSGTPIEIARTLTAINKNTVRFFHRSVNEEALNLDDYGITLAVDEATGEVSIMPWKHLAIIENSGSGTYQVIPGNYGVNTRKYTIKYNYINSSNKEMHVSVTLETSEN